MEYANPSFTKATGYELQEIIGKIPSLLQSNEASRDIYKDLWNTISSGKTWTGEIENKRKDGSLCLDYVVASPVKD
ncbi:PAS domain-containing protein, partial [Pseudomonadota bacterium]